MYIQLEYDYNADTEEERRTGVYVHIDDLEKPDEEGEFALIRIENDYIVWYESQNGDVIGEAKGKYIEGENLELIRELLLKLYPDSDIDTSELEERRILK